MKKGLIIHIHLQAESEMMEEKEHGHVAIISLRVASAAEVKCCVKPPPQGSSEIA